MRRDEDPCERCGVEAGSEVINGLFVCHKCAKKIKKELKIKSEMDTSIVEQLRRGVMSSPLVERRIKALLQD